MKKDDFEWVSINELRIGLFVELDVGWMSHPFPTGSFKISNDKQIDTLRGLGVDRIKVILAKSDAPLADVPDVSEASAAQKSASDARAAAALREQQLRKARAEQFAAQNKSLIVCERRFGESVRQYRKTIDTVQSCPQEAARQCIEMVQGFVSEMMQEGESAIRLLTEASGDKSAMHPVNVTVVSLLLGKAIGMEAHALLDLGTAAFLHDIGKIELPERVRWPDDSFTTPQFKLYQDHVAQSVRLARAMELSNATTLAIAQHHELADGSGFPARIQATSMTQAARILSLVNRYDNLCNPTKQGSAMTPHEALALMFSQQKARFDTMALSAFIRMMGVYPPGSVVQLVDERYAMVVSVNSTRPLKPRVVVHEPGVPKHEALIVDLERAPNVGIRRSMKPSSLPAAAQEYLAPRQRICYFFESAGAHTEEEAQPA